MAEPTNTGGQSPTPGTTTTTVPNAPAAPSAPKTADMEGPGAAKKQLAATDKATWNTKTKKWVVPGYGEYTEQELGDLKTRLKYIVGQEQKNTKKTIAKKKVAPKKTADKTNTAKWKETIQKEFGSLWDVYNDNPDVKKVIDQSVKEGWYNDSAKLTASLQNTGWFRTTQQSVRQSKILQSTDPATYETNVTSKVDTIKAQTLANGYALSDATLRKLAEDSIKFNYSDVQLVNAIGSEAVADAQLRGATGIADLRQGSVARDLYAKAAAYFQKPSQSQIDTWTQEIMTGTKSATQWEDLMRSSARTQFRSLQPALDKGQDVETAMYAYKQQTANVLGTSVDPNNIDWTQDKWNRALNYQDPKTGEYRQMDLWEWNKYLRTLPEWQNTDDAKNTYRNVAYALAQGFGKMA